MTRLFARPRLRVAVALSALAVPLGLAVSSASTPATSKITVPSVVGQKVTQTWTGTIPSGADVDSTCSKNSAADQHAVALTVPPGVYDAVEAVISFKITWQPNGGVEDTSDQILTVLKPDGKALGSSDGGNPEENVTDLNLAGGTYTALACGFLNVAPQAYKGEVTITTKTPPPFLPVVDPQGLAFSASVPSDPVRDEGEPSVVVDRGGNIYTCGPSGFSQIADYAQVSTDGGDQFHLLGTPPRGQISTGEGGGDCALATSPVKNDKGQYTLAYAGLGPLTNFSTFTSPDTGRTLFGSPISESPIGVDRQWITFTDAKTAFLTYNRLFPSGKVVQKSTDGGFSYAPAKTAAAEGGRIGQIRSFQPPGTTDPKDAFIYLPYGTSDKVKIALSQDGGETYSQCVAVDAGVDPNAGFVAADHDDAGNVYVTYSEKGGGRDTFLVSIPFEKFKNCKGTGTARENLTNPGFSNKLKLNRAGVETSLFPWVAASGEPGKVAVAYYGTRSIGDPDSGEFDATWHVYVSQVLNALDPAPDVAQVQATTHPFHYDSICTAGLGCTINGADRSLVDFFSMEYLRGDPAAGRVGKLAIVYSQPAKKPNETEGHVATPVVLTQVAGPSNGGGTVDGGFRKQVLRSSSPDPKGDATNDYSSLTPGPPGTPKADFGSENLPALDLVGSPAVTVGPEVDLSTGKPLANGGFTVTMRYADLSTGALNGALSAARAGSLIYLFRFVDGYQPAAATARYTPAGGFSFAFSGYHTVSAECGSAGEKCQTYPADKEIPGKVDQKSGTITLSVSRDLLVELGGLDETGERPKEQKARTGSRLYDATAFTLSNLSPDPDVQSYMYQTDNAPAFDFLIPATPGAPGGGGTGGGGNGGGGGTAGGGNDGGGGSGSGRAGGGSGNLAATGGLGEPLVALALLMLAVAVRQRSSRRRRRA